MTKDEFRDLVLWLKDRWPTSRNWAHAANVYFDFAYLPAESVRDIAQSFYNAEHKHGPTFSELKGGAAQLAKSKGLIRDEQLEGCAPTRHVWAIVDEFDRGGIAFRLGVCAVCHTEKRFPADKLRTPGEKAEDRAERATPTEPDPEYDTETERIAP